MDPLHLQLRTLDVDGIERTYWLTEGRPRAPAPLLVALHGIGETGHKLARRSGLAEACGDAGFNVVFPDGLERVWDDHGTGRRDGADDDRFFAAMVAWMEARGEIGEQPPFVVGVGNGACFAERLAREGVHPLAGVALVGGTARVASRQLTPHPVGPIPLLAILGNRAGRRSRRVGLRTRLALRHTGDHRQIPADELLADWTAVNEPADVELVRRPLRGRRNTGEWPRGEAGRRLATEVAEFAQALVEPSETGPAQRPEARPWHEMWP
jgi:poly(3-hydroxybutyrate) depolymerase